MKKLIQSLNYCAECGLTRDQHMSPGDFQFPFWYECVRFALMVLMLGSLVLAMMLGMEPSPSGGSLPPPL